MTNQAEHTSDTQQDSNPGEHLATLQHHFAQLFAGANVTVTHSRACPEIRLWLAAPDCLSRRFSEAEQLAIANDPAYWSVCWPGGLALARYLLDNPTRVAGKSVMDIGAGSGIVAIAAALAGARRVIACDLDPIALHACAANAALNGIELELLQDFQQAGEVDLITAADLLYDDSNQALLDAFQRQAKDIWLAESRAGDIQHADYSLLASADFPTEPDIQQTDFYQRVQLYHRRVG
ncbi:50S ribosomal protein L11 methyltransferase [Oceanobacter kriegii]|uniref:50S ribosomal protein L11 methyltransferase n=1 Tax=Oceanobacter kriegii TaxID=64972 RepID=UPI00040DCE36|nr:50S ribosomal protein L11 methyltransferase [Oceanobacter kriegii]